MGMISPPLGAAMLLVAATLLPMVTGTVSAHCTVDFGTCTRDGHCTVNLGHCDGHCEVNLGRCVSEADAGGGASAHAGDPASLDPGAGDAS